jgi:hypothetical protein
LDRRNKSLNDNFSDYDRISNNLSDDDSTEISSILNDLKSCRTDKPNSKLDASEEILNILKHEDKENINTNNRKIKRIDLKNKILKSKTFSYSNKNVSYPERVSNPFVSNFLY